MCLNNIKDIDGKKYYTDELKFNDTLCNGFVVYQYNKDDYKQISKNTYVTCGEEYVSEAITNGTIDLNDYPNCEGVVYPTKYKYVVYHDNDTGKTKTDCLYDKLGTNGAKEGCVASSAYKVKSNLFTKKFYVLDYWTTDPESTENKIEANSNSSKLPFSGYNNEEVHLYANWKLDIDRQAPVITINALPSEYSLNTQQITGSIDDELGGLVSGNISYALTTTKTTPTSGWKDTSKSKIDFSDLSATSNSTYYVHAKDKQGNTSYKSININNIAILKSHAVSAENLNDSVTSSSVQIPDIVKLDSVVPVTGSVNFNDFSLSEATKTVAYKVTGNSYSKVIGTTPVYTYANSRYIGSSYCNSYYCPYGGSLSGTSCTDTYQISSYNTNKWLCSNGKMTNTGSAGQSTPCPSGYFRDGSYWTDHACDYVYDGASCTSGGSCGYNAYATCYKNYTATCANYYIPSCNSGEYQSGDYCYYCTSGTINGSQCLNYENVYTTKYRYSFNINYWIKK